MKGKLANGVGSQYSSHYLGTCCIQRYLYCVMNLLGLESVKVANKTNFVFGFKVVCGFFLIFVVPSIMLYSSEISPTRCNSCVFILHNGFTLHVSGDNLTHHQEYIWCIWPQVSRLT